MEAVFGPAGTNAQDTQPGHGARGGLFHNNLQGDCRLTVHEGRVYRRVGGIDRFGIPLAPDGAGFYRRQQGYSPCFLCPIGFQDPRLRGNREFRGEYRVGGHACLSLQGAGHSLRAFFFQPG